MALVVNSGLIKPEVAHYMFGYHIVRCWKSDAFWAGVNRQSPYWSLFRDFADQMSRIEDTFEYRRGFVRAIDLPFGRQEITVNISPVAVLYR